MSLLGSQSGYVGVVLTSCLNMVGMMQWGLRQSAVMENTMTSVERIAEYGRLQSEAELVGVIYIIPYNKAFLSQIKLD